MLLCIPAWRGAHYLSLAELLPLAAAFYPGRSWSVEVGEVAPEPGAGRLEGVPAGTRMSLSELLELVSPDLQLIDGEARAWDGETLCLRVRAIDGSSWDVDSDSAGLMTALRERYPDARDAPA